MESTRLNKIGRLIQKELSDIFLKQANESNAGRIDFGQCRTG